MISNSIIPAGILICATSPTFLPNKPFPIGEDIDISLDTTFGELAEMQRLILEKAENQES